MGRCDCSQRSRTLRSSPAERPWPQWLCDARSQPCRSAGTRRFVYRQQTTPMNRFRLALILTLAFASPAALAQDSIEKVNGSITAEAGRSYGSLNTVNGSITIEDRVRTGDAGTVNGGIRGGDDVEAEDLATVNGGIRFGERLNLRGGIETVNGSVFLDS